MSCKQYFIRVPKFLCVRGVLTAIAVTCLFAVPAFSQTDRPLTWEQDLSYLEQLSPSEALAQRGAIRQIRKSVEDWLKQHSDSGISLQPASEMPVTPERVMSEVQALQETVEKIVKADPHHPFHLGRTDINVAESVSPLQSSLSSTAGSIDQETIAQQNLTLVSKVLDNMPGVFVQHASGQRNEAKFSIRGFTSSGQIPLYLDGIPITVPYDGNLDLNRFLTSDVAEIQVSRGISSPLLGPNALGGAVNIVTKEPQRRFEGDALIGAFSGDGLLAGLRIGTRWSKFFAQGTVDWRQNNYVPLSGDLVYPTGGYTVLNTAPNVPYPLTDHENNSYSRDEKWSGRVGWTPRKNDEYVFSYINQKGNKGAPLYMGPYANASFKAFWNWPYWNKDSYYFLSNTGIGEKGSLKTRVFYDQFRNSIDMWDNSTFSTMNSASSQHSKYDDHADGFSTEYTTAAVPRNLLSFSFFFKDDTHKELGIYPASNKVTPTLVDRSQQSSIGLQDIVKLTPALRITLGLSADHLDGLQAEFYNSSTNTLLPVKCASDLTNSSFAGCTAHVWAFNPQVSASYVLTESDRIFVTFADRSRFPLMKDSYSYKMGTAIPNPDLKPEHSRNWNLGYARTFGRKTTAQVEFFRSDLRNAIQNAYVPDPGLNDGDSTTPATCGSQSYTGMCAQPVNISKAVYQGVEFEFRTSPWSWLNLDGNYSYLSRSYDYYQLFPGATAGDFLMSGTMAFRAGVPSNKLIGTATILGPKHIEGFVGVRYEGGNNIQDTNATKVSVAGTAIKYAPFFSAPFATMDLGVQFPLYKTLKVQSGVKNLLDRNYLYSAGYPEPGRNWYLNLRYQF